MRFDAINDIDNPNDPAGVELLRDCLMASACCCLEQR
jgi:hypothetical protein